MSFWDFFITNWDEVMDQAIQHLTLTLLSMLIATAVGVLIGIVITRIEKMASITLGFVGVIQTIPSLALLGFLLPLVGIGTVPAIIALFLYALLPIVRNTYTGIREIDPAIIEASMGMGMTRGQLFRMVELPLAFPMILAGIRTSAVINVGIATLCALIAAGGLGEFIFRGISLNNTNMILAGAIPASILAISLDALLGLFQRHTRNTKLSIPIVVITILIMAGVFFIKGAPSESKLIAGFNSEFIEREDGFTGLDSLYHLPMEIKEMEISLMYRALYEGDVDVIDGFSTDGRIREFDLKSLIDDKRYFPPYYAIPLVGKKIVDKYPEVIEALALLEGKLDDLTMANLNYLVDSEQLPLDKVANDFLKSIGIYASRDAGSHEDADIIIGSKAFTENFLLSYLFAQVIENKTNLTTDLKLGFGGTKLVFDALRYGEIDLYPEYSGTAFLVLLGKSSSDISDFADPDVIFQDVKESLMNQYSIETLNPLGFNNTFALMMRRTQSDSLGIRSISDLSQYLNKK